MRKQSPPTYAYLIWDKFNNRYVGKGLRNDGLYHIWNKLSHAKSAIRYQYHAVESSKRLSGLTGKCSSLVSLSGLQASERYEIHPFRLEKLAEAIKVELSSKA